MTSAERAKELLVYMASLPDTPDVDTTLAVFAAAITQAQNDKLEEAALMLEAGRDHMRSKASGANARILAALVTELAVDVRSLKKD